MKKRFILNLIAIVLVLTFSINFVPVNAIEYIADSIKQDQDENQLLSDTVLSNDVPPAAGGEVSQTQEIDTSSPAKILKEATEYRGENIKTFRMSNGTYQSVMYSRPIHYQDDDIWKEIDNTLTYTDENLDTYTTTNMPYTVTFVAKTNGNKLVTYDTGDISASLTPAYIKNGKAKKLSNKIDKSNIEVSDNYAFYGDVYENADLEYLVEAYRIKENIIVNSKSDTYEYVFLLNIDKKDAEAKLENGVINICQKGADKPSLYISAPMMTDNNGVISDLVTLSLEKQKEGEYFITVTADSSWMNEEDRCFPVRIDPTIEDYLFLGFDNICSWDGVSGYDYLLFKDDVHAYFTYEIPEMPENAKILDSKVLFYLHMPRSISDISTGYMTISAYRVTSSWDRYDVQDGTEPTTGTILDKGVYDMHDTFSGTDVVLDITAAMAAWYQGQENYGIMLDTQFSNISTTLGGSLHYYDDLMIITSFVIPDGLDNKWSTHSISADERAGTAYIKDINGELIYVHPDISTTGNLLPVSISHIYNRNNSEHDAYYGKGWTLNVLQTIKAAEVYLAESIDTNYYYIHTDATGNKTYFYRESYNSNFYINEKDPTVYYSSRDKQIFYADGSSIKFNSDGYVCLIYDSTTNSEQIYTYSAPGKISSIEDGAGSVIVFEYNTSGLLDKIYLAKKPTRCISFSYYGSAKYLGNIEYGDDSYSALGYNTSKGLTYADYHTGEYGDYYQGILITYDNSNRVDTAYTTYYDWDIEYEIQNATIKFEYGSSTVVTYLNPDAANENIYSETIYFDQAGRTIGVIDSEGYFSYGEYASGDLSLFDVIERRTTGKVAVENLLLDGDMQELNLDWSTHNSDIEYTGPEEYYTWAQKPELGEHGLIVYNETDEIDYVFAIQDINAQAGETYTVSAVLAEHDFTIGVDGAVVGFIYTDSNGNEQIVHGEPNYSGKYERFAYTYTFPEGSSSFYALLGIYGAAVYGMFDLVQVEIGASISEYNFIRNSNLQHGATQWSHNGTSVQPSSIVALPSYSKAERKAEQTICLELEAGTQISVGGWCKGLLSLNGKAGIRLSFIGYSGAFQEREVLFDYHIRDQWMYKNDIIEVPIDCSEIRFSVFSYMNIGSVSFHGMSLEIVNLFDEISDGADYEYDEYGRMIRTNYYDGSIYECSYDEETGLVDYEIITDSKGNITSTVYYYNANTGFLYYTYTEYEYSNDSNALVRTESYYERDSRGNVIREFSYVEDDEENRSLVEHKTYTYSDNKNVCVSVTDEENKITTYTYNELDELLTYTTSDGLVAEYKYDDFGYLTSIIEKKENSTSQKEVNYKYSYGLLDEIAHNRFSYFFDYADNRSISSIAVGTSSSKRTLASYEYNGVFGQVSKMTYGNGQYKNYTYDEKGRLLSVTFNAKSLYGGSTYEWMYDDRGNVVSTKANGITTNYSYDSEGRIKTITDSNGNSVWKKYYSKDNKSEYSYLSSGYESYSTFEYVDDPTALQNKTIISSDGEKQIEVLLQGDMYGRVETQSSYKDNTQSFEVSYDYDNFDYLYNSAMYGIMETSRVNEITYTKKSTAGDVELLPKLEYSYYNDGNIMQINENGSLKVRYYYDEYNQLIREDNKYLNNGDGYTILYTYNSGGNMVLKKIYTYTTAPSITSLSPIDTILYGYDSNWKDILTSVDGMQITRDNMGNPTNYYGMSMAWGYGNKLTKLNYGPTTFMFDYNQNGLRTRKYIGSYSNRIEYFWIDNVLQSENYVGRYEIVYCYDASGSLFGFTYETANQKTFYHYVKNLQGDVIALLDENYNVVVKYTYDTWGQVLSVTDSSGTLITNTNHIGHINPIRYRGYYYDNESGFYYLQSRYYDPYVGRFINAENLFKIESIQTNENLFAFLGNCPIYIGIKIEYKVKKQHNNDFFYPVIRMRDVTEEINKALKAEVDEIKENMIMWEEQCNSWKIFVEISKYVYFYDSVKPNAKWDIKIKAVWEKTIGTPYPGFNTKVIYNGMKMTPEQLGNYTYGYLGREMQMPYEILVLGSYYAADFPLRGEELSNEIDDWRYILMGYRNY